VIGFDEASRRVAGIATCLAAEQIALDLASGPTRLRLVGESFAGSPGGGARLERLCVQVGGST